jgi:alpha-D-xyloside xylohydrolase
MQTILQKFLPAICALVLATAVSVSAAPPDTTATIQKQRDGVLLTLPSGTLRLQVWSDRIIRVTFAPGTKLPAKKSLCVIAKPAATKWSLSETPGAVVLQTDALQARADRKTGAVGFYDLNGNPILQGTPDGAKAPPEPGGAGVQQSFVLAPDEAIYGLGQHQAGLWNYRGTTVHLQQKNMEVAIPVLVSSKGYGVLWDNPAVTDVNCGGGRGEMIPAAQFLDENGEPGGLTARYYRGDNFEQPVRTNVEAQVDFDWSDTPPAGLPHDDYSVRWTGFVEAKKTADYTFVATADDGVRLWIDGREVINDWQVRGAETFTAKVHFEAGSRHRIRLEYFQNHGGAVVQLAWQIAGKQSLVTWNSEAGNVVDYYFMFGPTADGVIQDYRKLTGAAPMMGRWVWGFWQCKEHYASQEELTNVVARYRQMQVPLDGIIQDWQYWPKDKWGSHQFDPTRYPHPAQMIQGLHAMHAHVMISVWARFDVGTSNYNELERAGALYATALPGFSWFDPKETNKYYDAFNPVARRLYWREMDNQLFKLGIDAWWLDASEPELSIHWGEFRQYQTALGPASNVFNAYPLMHTTAVYQGQRAATSAKRVCILTRSAWAGQQRNAAITWSGDIHGRWDVFAKQIPAGLNFSISGIPYWNTDIGGFFGAKLHDPKYQELFTRWFQFGAFCPLFRVHGTDAPKEIWRWDQPTQKILEKFIDLRYRLLPYIYSVSWQVTSDGGTIMRPLMMDFPDDPQALDIGSQYLFGPALMVCPVTQPGVTNWSVDLPGHSDWYDFWTGKRMTGGQRIEATSPIGTLPLFVRAGSILPLGPVMQYTSEKPENPIELRVYRGADGGFTLYEDQGDGYNYERGVYATIPLTWNESRGTLTIGARQGKFSGMLQERTFRVVFVGENHGAGGAAAERADAIIQYDGKAVTVQAPNTSK